MHDHIKESDWKIFRPLHDVALDRLFKEAVSQMQQFVGDEKKTCRERFFDVLVFGKEQQKEIARLFDGLSRSNALFQLASIYSRKLLTDEEMSRFSEETRDFVQRFLRI